MTESVKSHLSNLARAVLLRRHPILLQGPTSAGKTSLIEYLAKRTGHRFIVSTITSIQICKSILALTLRMRRVSTCSDVLFPSPLFFWTLVRYPSFLYNRIRGIGKQSVDLCASGVGRLRNLSSLLPGVSLEIRVTSEAIFLFCCY